MNKGKLYLRKEGVRKNKKKTTRMKKIIYKYRALKKNLGVQHDELNNVLLNKEFLDLLNHHIGSDFDLSSDCDKQILLFNFFTDRKKRNKIWDKMRDCIRDSIDKNLNKLKSNLEYNIEKDIIIDDTYESDCHKNKDDLNESDDINKDIQIKDNSNDITQNINVNEEPSLKYNDATKNDICDLEISQNNKRSETNNLSLGKENFTKSAIIDNALPSSQTFSSKKQKRLQKKMQRKLALNLDKTIVVNKSKTDGEAVGIVESKKDLMNIVDAVAKKEDIQQLCSVKLQIHSRSFRP